MKTVLLTPVWVPAQWTAMGHHLKGYLQLRVSP